MPLPVISEISEIGRGSGTGSEGTPVGTSCAAGAISAGEASSVACVATSSLSSDISISGGSCVAGAPPAVSGAPRRAP